MSNTFDGILGEFPFIGVDRFNSSASSFLLTHCHADHLTGFENKSFTGLVYCSEETKELLSVIRKDSPSLKLTNALPYNVRTRLELPTTVENVYGEVFVTLIRSYHCVGSCMFLVENSNGAVLVTGDIRAEKWWCNSLHNNALLYPYLNGHKTLDNIYFDSTFGYRGEPYIEMPANNSGIHTAICLLKDYPKNDPEVAYVFQDTVLGFEQAWAFVLSYFGASLKISNERLRSVISIAAKYDETNGPALKRALRKAQSGKHARGGSFHTNPPNLCEFEQDPIIVRIKQCINFNVMDFAGVCCPILLETMARQERLNLQLIQETKMGTKLYRVRDRCWILPRHGSELLPIDVKLVFSRHSSYSETSDFLSMFRPRQVFPCCYSKTNWLNGFSMRRLFGKCCSGDIFHFDSLMLSLHGPPIEDLHERPVATIDRWNAAECKEEEKFVKDIVRKNDKLKAQGVPDKQLALINIRRVVHVPVFWQDRSKADREFMLKRSKDFSLQKIVEGRRDISYRKFIESQQQLYYKKHNLPQSERDFEAKKYQRDFDSTLGGTSDYDTDSCSSSLDLAEMATRTTSPVAIEQKSVISESPNSWNGRVLTPIQISNVAFHSSFVKSSFDSFEESKSRKRPHLLRHHSLQTIYFNPEKRLNTKRIDSWSHKLMETPYLWNRTGLQCTRSR